MGLEQHESEKVMTELSIFGWTIPLISYSVYSVGPGRICDVLSIFCADIEGKSAQFCIITFALCVRVFSGPTVLEVFNTLLKHLRMSVDFELGDGSRRNSASSLSSTRTKESEERIVQNAIIQTIGDSTTCSLKSDLLWSPNTKPIQ